MSCPSIFIAFVSSVFRFLLFCPILVTRRPGGKYGPPVEPNAVGSGPTESTEVRDELKKAATVVAAAAKVSRSFDYPAFTFRFLKWNCDVFLTTIY